MIAFGYRRRTCYEQLGDDSLRDNKFEFDTGQRYELGVGGACNACCMTSPTSLTLPDQRTMGYRYFYMGFLIKEALRRRCTARSKSIGRAHACTHVQWALSAPGLHVSALQRRCYEAPGPSCPRPCSGGGGALPSLCLTIHCSATCARARGDKCDALPSLCYPLQRHLQPASPACRQDPG